MNLLEDAGGRICGTEYLFSHALDPIPDDVAPLEALARTAVADRMAGSPLDRAERICRDAARFGAEALVISRIPGASHCALEGSLVGHTVRRRLGLPVVEIEVPPRSRPPRTGSPHPPGSAGGNGEECSEGVIAVVAYPACRATLPCFDGTT